MILLAGLHETEAADEFGWRGSMMEKMLMTIMAETGHSTTEPFPSSHKDTCLASTHAIQLLMTDTCLAQSNIDRVFFFLSKHLAQLLLIN